MIFLVKEISNVTYRHTRKWLVDIDEGTDFNYRGRMTVNAFFYSPKHRNMSSNFTYVGKPVEEAIEFGENVTDVKAVDSMWDFYKIIGYDYKKKKYQ